MSALTSAFLLLNLVLRWLLSLETESVEQPPKPANLPWDESQNTGQASFDGCHLASSLYRISQYEVAGNCHSKFMVSEALQQFFMATKLACPSSLPWIWVIEALASSSEIDTSLLINLLKRTPEISDDLERNAREMVSLRVLESLFVQKNLDANSVASVPGEKVELDPSRDCEDVLRRILLEVSASNLKTATPDMLKWDVLSFIMKKRSILPKCHLQILCLIGICYILC